MSTAIAAPSLAERLRLPSWWPLAGLFVLLLALAALRPLALPDEGRYGEIGRWMAASGDWLTPRVNGLPFFHKPPLLYWLEAVSVTLFGATPWALRLVVVLHAGLMMAALYGAARTLGGERLAHRAALMLGASPAFLLGGQYVNHDMMVAAWIGVAIWCFAAAFLHGERPHAAWALAGFVACALGVLGKGLIGVALPGLVLFVWLLWTRQFAKVWRLPWLRGLLLFAAIAVPWFVLVEQRYPGVFNYLFGVQQFSRYTGSGFNNAWPWWFYLPCMAVLLFPWVIFAVYEGVAEALQWRRQRVRPAAQPPASLLPREALSLCWIWIVAILVFFSIPSSKLLGYILPVMPPLALLAAVGWGRWMDSRRAAGTWFAVLFVLSLVAMGVANEMVGRYASRVGSRGIAQVLARTAAPDDPVYAAGGFPYDLAFYARMSHPVIVVQDWTWLRAKAGDDWRRELFEAGNFDPASAARLLQSPPAALDAARAAPNAWVVVATNRSVDVSGLHLVAREGYWALYASSALRLPPGN
ncbi:MAG: glycosyltransferase family 39 protein [Burkholderiaceae bacterium]|jgi:4-amino-4-deoxy-L-arabinose transferase-like glycosyltransferase|nr:glycosyltransferase family 39 protein [Burkholderiaceae bacterium]